MRGSEVSLHHRHVAVIIVGRSHVLAGTVHIVGIVTVKHPEDGHQLTHADEQTAVLTLHDVGTLQIGRNAQRLFNVGCVDISHALAHHADALPLKVAKHALGCDKRRAVGIDDFHLDMSAQLTTRLVARPHNTDSQRNSQQNQYAILYQPFHCFCFLNSTHICGSRLAISPAPAVNKTSKLLNSIDLIKFSLE